MKIINWIKNNILFLFVLFFLAFIPLYPKLPLFDIKNTWVYIRLEDFLIAFALVIWFFQLIRGKISLKTPLTFPILLFWLFGAIATLHAVLIIFPTIANVFSNVAFLSFLRRIEYISLFFIAFSAMRNKQYIPIVVGVMVLTLLLVFLYGIGQRYFGFPAFLTMNEEYAKGVPIYLSPQSRVPSTFGGHYDLAAYLVLIIPILTSMIFGFRNWAVRIVLFISIGLGFVLLFMTVSRVSFFVLLIALGVLLFLQKRKLFFFSLPIVLVFLLFLALNFSNSLFSRFGNTVKEVDVLVDAKTGDPIGHVKTVKTESFTDKLIVKREFSGVYDFLADPDQDLVHASSSAIVPRIKVPPVGISVIPPDTPTGENLPQGSGYVNLTLSQVNKRLSIFFYERPVSPQASESAYVKMFTGNFLVKRAQAYDLSFTTRFQGEWPNAVNAFKRNIFFGSGYSSISLAVDNNFLRILGEIGIVGFISFLGMFIMAGIYIKKILPDVDSPLVRCFVLGFVAGVIGLFFNAVFIDVFEASKIAYLLWLLMGIAIGILFLYQEKHISLLLEIKKVLTSHYAIFAYICVLAFVIYWQMTNNFFIGDDYTWFRWSADCSTISFLGECPSLIQRTAQYFTQAEGFFYRPGTKVYFFIMYSLFWLNPQAYHIVSLALHVLVTMLLYFLVRKVFRDNGLAAFSAILFLILSGYTEVLFWISTIGFLFNALFILLGVLLYIRWKEKRRVAYYILSLVSFTLSLFFHELGVVAALLILLYEFVTDKSFKIQNIVKKAQYLFLFIPLLGYLIVRYFAQSHWFSGDYNYNILKLPFNVFGNIIGYFFLSFLGPSSLSIYHILRTTFREQILLVMIVFLVAAFFVVFIAKKNIFQTVTLFMRRVGDDEKRIVVFGVLFFIITLLPFLGLGNITSRYSYLASFGVAILIVFVLRKIYKSLLKNGRDIAFVSLMILVSVFSLYHVIQTQQVYSDWREAGVRTKRFLTSIDSMYEDFWANHRVEFYFVDVPIRVGSAWMFPVGLEDALWLIFRNPSIKVYQEQSLDTALRKADGGYVNPVFLFGPDGSVVQVKRSKEGIPIYDQ